MKYQSGYKIEWPGFRNLATGNHFNKVVITSGFGYHQPTIDNPRVKGYNSGPRSFLNSWFMA
jgi:hypothetical protein